MVTLVTMLAASWCLTYRISCLGNVKLFIVVGKSVEFTIREFIVYRITLVLVHLNLQTTALVGY